MNDNPTAWITKELPDAARNGVEPFGFNPWLFVAQLLFLAVIIVLPIAATIHCLRHHRPDRELPLPFWLLFVWLVPVAGPLCALAAFRRQASLPIES